jgi:hypothetical protein
MAIPKTVEEIVAVLDGGCKSVWVALVAACQETSREGWPGVHA